MTTEQSPSGDAKPESASDCQLLERFARHGEEDAFRQLVLRHGKLVLGVCRRVLRDRHYAEDAFQATFMKLARKGRQLRGRSQIAGWLYGTAYRIALNMRSKKYRRREVPLSDEPTGAKDTLSALAERYDQELLDEELNRLPQKIREPLVLHYLLGKTTREVAEELSLSIRTAEGRLRRGRNELRYRLARRGVSLPITAAAVFKFLHSPEIALATPLVDTTVKAGMGTSSGGSGCSNDPAYLARKELSVMGTAKHATSVLVVLSALVILLGTGGDSGQRTSVARQPSALKYATGSYRTYVAEENPAFLVTHRTDDDENKKSGQAERSTPQRSPAMPKEIVEELLRMDAYKLGIIVSEGDEGRERRISNSWPLALKFQPLREGLPAQHPEDSIWKDYEKIARVPFPFWYHVQVGQLDQRDETATVLFMISEGHDASYERNRLSWTAHNQAIIEEVNLGNDTTLVFPKSDDGAGRRLHVQLNVEKWKGEQYAIPQKSNVLTYNDNAVTPELGALQDAMWVGGGLIYNTESIDFLGQPGVPPGMPPESVQMLLRRHPYDVEIILSEGDEDNKRDVAGKTLLALKYQPTRGGRTAQHPDGSIWKDYKGITAGPKPLWYAVQILEQEGHTAKVLFVIAQASDFSYDGKRLAWTADMQAVIEEARLGEDTTIGLRRSGKDDAGQRLYVRLNVKKWDP